MSNADFDVVTGPSMQQRRVPPAQQSHGSPDQKSDRAVPLVVPTATPRDAEEKRR
jgi:hypothetical protein